MWSKSVELLNPYEAIKADIENGAYKVENLSLWKRVFRVSYSHNLFGIYKEIYLFNKKVYCRLICRYSCD